MLQKISRGHNFHTLYSGMELGRQEMPAVEGKEEIYVGEIL